ncbi:MAG: class I SAM-dependent methyltransferase [Bacteroidia bacterium]|nr:class I SAM-dependent methyltransferase [Bacteroidia bacterium]
MSEKSLYIYESGEYWNDIPDYLAGQAPNKIKWLLQIVDFDALIKELPQNQLAIVDIGCGVGMVSTGLAEQLRNRYPEIDIEHYGFDLSPHAIEVARKRNNNGTFVCGDFKTVEKRWDLALLCDIIEHVEDPNEFLQSVAERSRFFVVGFAMDNNVAYHLSKSRRKIVDNSSHISLFNETRARSVGGKFGRILASGYIPNPMARNLKIRSVKNIITLPLRMALQVFSRRLKGRLFGGESLYLFCESRLDDSSAISDGE